MKDDNLFAKLKKDVCSLLISSQLGLDPDQLRRDYGSMLGHPMPLRQLGFRNVMDMVKEMPDVVSVHFNSDGSIVLKAVGKDATKNIEALVAKQRVSKSCKKLKNKNGNYFSPRFSHFSRPVILPRRGPPPPVLPAVLRAQIHLLLSQGPIPLSKLESAYQCCFGYRLHVQNFGFYSITEMLVSASDFLTIQQTRLGSVLDLRGRTQLMSPHTTFYKKTRAGQTRAGQTRPGLSKARPDLQVKQCPANPVTEEVSTDSVKKESAIEQEVDVQSKEEVEDCQRAPLFHEQVLKLEGEFRQQILQNGVAGSISQELKDKLKEVVGQSRDGIPVHSIPEEYERVFGEQFPMSQSGFLNVTELIGAMNDTFHLQPDNWIVTNKEACPDTPQDQCQKSYYLNSEESRWEQEQEDNITNGQDEERTTDCDFKIKEKDSLQTDLVIQVHCNSHMPPDAIQSQHIKPPTKHGARQLLEVLVELVESPGNFYIRFSEGEEAKAFEEMMIEMRRCYNSPDVSKRYSLLEPYVRPGQVCCVTPKGMWFYRVIVHVIISPTLVKVYFVDFGDTATVHTANLKFLKSCFGILPAQAVPSTLAGIKPKDGTWSTEATRSFQKMCCDGLLVGALNCYIGDWLQLYLCDTHTDDDLYIHSALVSQGHGVASSSSASASVCLPFSPVSLYMGDEKLKLPNVEWEKTLPPKAVESLGRELYSGLKISDEELPPLEFIDGVGSVTQDKNPFQALLTDHREYDVSLPTVFGCPSSSPLSPPDSVQRTQAKQKADPLSPRHKSKEETLQPHGATLAESPSILRSLSLLTPHLG